MQVLITLDHFISSEQFWIAKAPAEAFEVQEIKEFSEIQSDCLMLHIHITQDPKLSVSKILVEYL